MKKRMLKCMALLLAGCLLFLTGCEKNAGEPAKTPEEFWASPHQWNSQQLMYTNANENGYYFTYDSNLYYFDYATKQCVILCNKVGCKHDDIECEAYLPFTFLFFRGEKMYAIVGLDDGVHVLQCDLDGGNRESRILLMKDEMEKGNAVGVQNVLIQGDALYYVAEYREPGDADSEKKDPVKAVRRLDLNSWTEEEICRSVENKYQIVGADENGVMLFERPDPAVVSKVKMDDFSDEEQKNGVMLLSKEEMKALPVTVFYWDQATGGRLTLYESNYSDTTSVCMVDGDCLYRMAIPLDGSDTVGLEKMNQKTGESTWLWRKDGSYIVECWRLSDTDICVSIVTKDGQGSEEMYTIDGFQKVSLPWQKPYDSVLFEDEHGYVVWKNIEHRPDGSSGDIVDIIFISREEAGKENPESTVLVQYTGN